MNMRTIMLVVGLALTSSVALADPPDVPALKATCDASRWDRLEHAKWAVVMHLEAENRLLKAAKAVKASCKLVQKPTGAVRIDRDRVYPEMRDEVQCSPLPKGVSKDDAYIILWRLRETGDVGDHGPILDREDHARDDLLCEPFDKAFGVDLDCTTWENLKSQCLTAYNPLFVK